MQHGPTIGITPPANFADGGRAHVEFLIMQAEGNNLERFLCTAYWNSLKNYSEFLPAFLDCSVTGEGLCNLPGHSANGRLDGAVPRAS